MGCEAARGTDVDELRAFLKEVDLTLAGLESPTVRLWVERDAEGHIVGSAGYEISDDGEHALVRSIGVAPEARTAGLGSRLARFALAHAATEGAHTAWIFSRRSGPFWQKLGFVTADREQLAAVLANTHQVQLFLRSGQLVREVAWSRALRN